MKIDSAFGIRMIQVYTQIFLYLGWCPAEDDLSPPMLIKEVLNFTVFIKTFIEFPEFSVKHKNMVDELQVCIFDPEKNKDCPIFSINYMLNEAEKNATERELMLRYGGVVRIKLDWDCNLDRHIKLCKPKYSFARLDVPFHEPAFSMGFNFRYSSNWKHESISYRTLTKAFGLRFIIAISGKAGKFDLITLTLNTGSIVGLFGLATFLCDIILLHLSKKANTYRDHVFDVVHLRTRTESFMHRAKTSLRKSSEYSTCPPEEPEDKKRKSISRTIVNRPLQLIDSDSIPETRIT